MADTQDEVKLDMGEIKEQLLGLRAQLARDILIKEQQVAEDGDDLDPERGGVGNHMADEANETSEQETMLTLQHSAERELHQVDGALARIVAGTYGVCINCGKQISPARLQARPFSAYCIDCQQLADRGRL